MSKILDYLHTQKQGIIRDLELLVNAESPSLDKPLLDKCVDLLAGLFTRLIDGKARILPESERGNHLLVEWGEGEEQILIIGHYDTVWPAGQRPFRIEGDKAYGPGIYDMKGGLIQGIWALKALQELKKVNKRVVFLCNSDEEIGSPTSRPIIEEEARRSKLVLVLEPSIAPLGALKTWRKGIGIFNLEITGRAAHAGSDPEKGISAVEELARQIIKLHAMNDFAKGTTVNVGLMEGGTRSNVVAARARAEIDLRVSTQAEADRVVPAILGLTPIIQGTTLKITGGMNRPPMERSEKTEILFKKAQNIAETIGLKLYEGGTGGGSDGNFTAALGVPTLDGLGAVGDGSHAAHEHVILSTLPVRSALIALLIERL